MLKNNNKKKKDIPQGEGELNRDYEQEVKENGK